MFSQWRCGLHYYSTMKRLRPADIRLTEQEQEVFALFIKTCEHYGVNTTVRAAGGWVRDKLLGTESNDIDIAVDDQSGEDFANKVRTYITEHSGVPAQVSRIGVVKANPDQSKHLATACFSLRGISFDVNNLRTETYTEDSRIPQICVGTPLEDAQRRDFCCNALFYNINERRVEDLVDGLQDLDNQLIRTPLDPSTTFADDPLRALRAVRFASRLNFTLDPGIIETARASELQEALLHKVSRERVGIEVEKMMKHTNAAVAADLLADLRLTDATFQVHLLSKVTWLDEGLRTLRVVRNVSTIAPRFAALFIALADETYLEKKKPRSVVYGIIREHLKLAGVEAELAAALAKAAKDLTVDNMDNLQVAGILLTVGVHYKEALNVAEAYYSRDYAPFRQWLEASGLLGCWDWKPYFDGKQLMEWGIPKGKDLGVWIRRQQEWRYANPQISEEDVKQRIFDGITTK
eukprot:GEMP01050217.1.p1 GENE.GEMP01050217.1~~GEMP01050217.1.p1  ORF type:complete len:464 (+),score=98.41 GEMP01050217.1:80-1471(+)